MLYVRQSIGGQHPSRVYGLRLEQASLPPTSPVAPVSSLVRHRELISLEFSPHTDAHLQFGKRVIWDVGTHEFAVKSVQPYSAFQLWNDGSRIGCSGELGCLKPQSGFAPPSPRSSW